jgi:hypothetical protein
MLTEKGKARVFEAEEVVPSPRTTGEQIEDTTLFPAYERGVLMPKYAGGPKRDHAHRRQTACNLCRCVHRYAYENSIA